MSENVFSSLSGNYVFRDKGMFCRRTAQTISQIGRNAPFFTSVDYLFLHHFN